jgi:hypothetical protein
MTWFGPQLYDRTIDEVVEAVMSEERLSLGDLNFAPRFHMLSSYAVMASFSVAEPACTDLRASTRQCAE